MKLVPLALAPLLLGSCVVLSVGHSEVTKHDKASSIEIGMSREQVQEVLGGQPTRIEFLPGDEVVWHYYRANLVGVTFLIISLTSGDVESIAVVFGPDGVSRVEGVPLKPPERPRRPRNTTGAQSR